MSNPRPDTQSKPEQPRRRAVAYVRMSTDLQQYSTENQMAVIERYAADNDMELVATYSDEARSGLRYENRPGMQRMLADAQSADAGFDTILVYDISRWGRFQDQDEGASLEFACRKAKVQVHYCMDQFINDGSPISTVVKSLKRYVAAEHSRVLSEKVFAGQCRLIELGYRQGGMAGLRAAPDAHRPERRAAGHSRLGPAQEPSDRPGDPRARTGRGSRDRPVDVPRVHRRRAGWRARSPRLSTRRVS